MSIAPAVVFPWCRRATAVFVCLLTPLPAANGAARASTADATEASESPAETVDGGLRREIEGRGVSFQGWLLLDATATLSGGARRGSALRYPLALTLDVDGERFVGWKGTRAHVGWRAHQGGSAADLVGDAQGVDNVDAAPFRRLFEAWIEQGLAGGRARVKAGRFDANTEFAGVESAAAFVHSSAGFSPTIVGFPSYPDPAPSFSAFADPAPWLHVGGGAFLVEDGSGGGRATFLVGELGFRWSAAGRSGRLALGRWRHGGTFERAGSGPARGAGGHYAVVEQQLVPPAAGRETSLALFVQAGEADGRASDLDRHLGLGLAWPGAVPGRPDDTIGVLLTTVRFSPDGPSAGGRETAVELVYDAQFGSRLGIRADLQRIANPGGAGRRRALVASARAEIRF
jgi:porin